jgi:hypothetical protein
MLVLRDRTEMFCGAHPIADIKYRVVDFATGATVRPVSEADERSMLAAVATRASAQLAAAAVGDCADAFDHNPPLASDVRLATWQPKLDPSGRMRIDVLVEADTYHACEDDVGAEYARSTWVADATPPTSLQALLSVPPGVPLFAAAHPKFDVRGVTLVPDALRHATLKEIPGR